MDRVPMLILWSSEPRYKSGINSFMPLHAVFLLEITMFCKFICQLLPWVRLPLEICPPLAPMLFKYRLEGDLCHNKHFHGWSVHVKKPKKLSATFLLVASHPTLTTTYIVGYIYMDVHFPVRNLYIFQLPQLYHLSRCGNSKHFHYINWACLVAPSLSRICSLQTVRLSYWWINNQMPPSSMRFKGSRAWNGLGNCHPDLGILRGGLVIWNPSKTSIHF